MQLQLFSAPQPPPSTPAAPPLPRSKPPQPLRYTVRDYKLVTLRETPIDTPVLDTPARAAQTWREHIATSDIFSPDREHLHVLLRNTRSRLLGFHLLGIGSVDTVQTRPAETFRAAVMANAKNIILTHNHPSGDPSPSDPDIKFTRQIRDIGRQLGVELLDHIILGDPRHTPPHISLRENGYLF